MLPAASVLAPQAAHPHLLFALVSEVRRLPALVASGVPPGLDEVVVWVHQGLLALLVEACACRFETLSTEEVLLLSIYLHVESWQTGKLYCHYSIGVQKNFDKRDAKRH
jgi:hypothetical protein